VSALRSHLANELRAKVERHGVVVWDDSEGAYRDVARELAPSGASFLAFDGSWYALRRGVEALLAGTAPPPLVVYVPVKVVDPDPLEELRAIGLKFTVRLPTLIKHALAGEISEQRAEQLGRQCRTIGDVESALGGADTALDARLVRLAGEGSSIAITSMIVDGGNTEAIAKEGLEDVARIALATSIGGEYPTLEGFDLRRAAYRQMVLAWLLEARGSLPTELEVALAPTTVAQRKTCIETIVRLRSASTGRDPYVELADAVDAELHLAVLVDWADGMVTCDASRAVETIAFDEGLRRLEQGSFERAEELAKARLESSWWTRAGAPGGDVTATRWRAIEALARLNLALESPPPELPTLDAVLSWYAASGWMVDASYRHAELLRVSSGIVIEELDDLFHAARRSYENWLDRVLRMTTDAIADAAVSTDRLQRGIHHRFVRNGPTPTAYVLVDALRFELGADLAERLRALDARVEIVPAIGTPPTITPIGMAAVLPDAETKFTVGLDASARLRTAIGTMEVGSVKDRVTLLEHAHGVVADLLLDDLAQATNKELRRRIDGAKLVLVRSTEIDADGEGDQLAASWGGFANTLRVLQTAVAKLLHAGVQRIVLTADHGFLAVRQLGEERRIDKPSTGVGELHRRAWIGRGGSATPSTIKAPLAAFGVGGDLEIIVPRGLGVFTAGGGLQFFHGGLSPQELVVPVITVDASDTTAEPQYSVELAVAGGRISTGVLAVTLIMTGDLFTRSSRVRVQLVQDRKLVGAVVGGDGFDQETDSIEASVDEPRVVTLQVTANLRAGSTATLEVLDAATAVRLGTMDVDVAATVLVDDDLD